MWSLYFKIYVGIFRFFKVSTRYNCILIYICSHQAVLKITLCYFSATMWIRWVNLYIAYINKVKQCLVENIKEVSQSSVILIRPGKNKNNKREDNETRNNKNSKCYVKEGWCNQPSGWHFCVGLNVIDMVNLVNL